MSSKSKARTGGGGGSYTKKTWKASLVCACCHHRSPPTTPLDNNISLFVRPRLCSDLDRRGWIHSNRVEHPCACNVHCVDTAGLSWLGTDTTHCTFLHTVKSYLFSFSIVLCCSYFLGGAPAIPFTSPLQPLTKSGCRTVPVSPHIHIDAVLHYTGMLLWCYFHTHPSLYNNIGGWGDISNCRWRAWQSRQCCRF